MTASGPYRVVVADDEPAIRSLTRYWLEQEGQFKVVAEASDGEQCVQAASRESPDLILLDLVMPKHDGMSVLPTLRRVAPNAKVVVLSMLQLERSRTESLHLGAAAFLDKGLESHELVAALLHVLGDEVASRVSR